MGAGQPGRRWFLLQAPSGLQLALDVDLVGRIESIPAVVPVPGAPPGVVGLAELAGRPVTLLDPALCASAASLGQADGAPRSALRLAAPHEHLALAKPPGATVRPLAGETDPPAGAARVDAEALARVLAGLVPARGRP